MSSVETGAAYLAAEGFELPLQEELARLGVQVSQWHGRLALTDASPVHAAWALDIWTDPRLIEIASVKQGASALRAIQRNWSLYAADFHRRAALIAENLPPLKAPVTVFPQPAPTGHLGGWTLLSPDLLLASPHKTSPFVGGECRFEEDRVGPPSRAYLKLWEACTRLGLYPSPGEHCMDLGASPGGWSWAIAKLGASVEAIDKAPLDLAVAAMPGVTWRGESAFGLDPKAERVDWLFSDIIAYPTRLLTLVRSWIAAGAARRILCTVKFQGETDHDTAEAFAAIEGGSLGHLVHNKHELTFFWSADRAASFRRV